MNQNKGIGAYKDRPGYFIGGMVGGAILGALVNKIQGKDWKKGALWGGIGGGLGSAFLGGTGWASKAATTPGWLSKMNPGIMNSLATWGTKNPHLAGAVIGTGVSYGVGDPEYDKKKQQEEMARLEDEQRRKNKEMYKDWYTNPWDDFNDGGEVMVEEETQIASAPHPMEGWYDMYDDMISSGQIPRSMKFEEFMEEIVPQLDIDIPMAARGGRIHAKVGGGISDLDMRLGGASNGPGTGTSDDIPAMLSDGEFVVTAKAVENLGGGDRMLGAQRMYQMMNKLDPNSQTPAEMTTVGYAQWSGDFLKKTIWSGS